MTVRIANASMSVSLTDDERENLETLNRLITHYAEAEELVAVEPGQRCPTCNRRVNKPRKTDSPVTREVRLRGPAGIVDDTEEHLDILQEYVGIDPYSYPRLKLVSALLALGARHREELREHFEGES